MSPAAAAQGLPPAVAGRAFLRDGTEVWVRPVQPADRELVQQFVQNVSLDTLEERYFAAIRPSAAGEAITAPGGPDDRLCLLVLADRSGYVSVLGVGEYVRSPPQGPLAEVAFLVGEPFRGLGIASLLLARLSRAAPAFGIRRFVARVRRANPEMLEVFRASGLSFTEGHEGDEVDVVFPVGAAGRRRGRGGGVIGPARETRRQGPRRVHSAAA